jgi:hypothetical protein
VKVKNQITAIALTGLSVLGGGCSSSSSTGTSVSITPGSDTSAYSAVYQGTLNVQAVLNITTESSQTATYSRNATVTVGINGAVAFKVEGVEVLGVVDNSGNWEVAATLALLGEEAKDDYESFGCSTSDVFAKITGTVSPPNLWGAVSGKLTCYQVLIPTLELETTGALTATQ